MEQPQLSQEEKRSLLPELQQYLADVLWHDPYVEFSVFKKLA